MCKSKVVRFFFSLALLVWLLVDSFKVSLKADSAKDLEIMVLGHPLRILQRKVDRTPGLSRPEKLILAVIADQFKNGVKGVRSRLNEA